MTNEDYLYFLEKKGLLFLETSALASTNVEAAFNNVLEGNLIQRSLSLFKSDVHVQVCYIQYNKVVSLQLCGWPPSAQLIVVWRKVRIH